MFCAVHALPASTADGIPAAAAAATGAASTAQWQVCTVSDDLAVVGSARPVGLRELAELDDGGVRWVWNDTLTSYPPMLAAGLRLRASHDISLTERILLGRALRHGEPCSAAAVVARLNGTAVPDDPPMALPTGVAGAGEPSLFPDPGAAPLQDVTDDGARSLDVLVAALRDQQRRIAAEPVAGALRLLVAAESASALAAAEIGFVGLPLRASVHEDLLTSLLGLRPRAGERPARLAELADEITAHFGYPVNPDSAVDLRTAFQRAGFDVTTTRAWVIKDIDHPAVPAVLQYKELARLFTANGWNWLRDWVSGDRFHAEYLPGGVVSGRWAARGGGGLQIPRIARAAVLAEPGHRLVVADAAQLEPRVLAAISRDPALEQVAATDGAGGVQADLYAALAADGFGGERAQAKVAMLGAMYGATTGESGRLLPTLRRRYPQALAFLERAAADGEAGRSVRSVLGRASPLPGGDTAAGIHAGALPEATAAQQSRAVQIARSWGRFTRNFVVQGSAADWASVWIAGLRRDLREVPGAELVFFQHDELIVHVPTELADEVSRLTIRAADEARTLVFPGSPVATPVRPLVLECYADAK
ncbi:bifunctional 3'-5' exonuclease/DNA polymerase [Nakamurella sp. A5-74]|uniref:DNA-directed DNA polymerase n=1 Tax=Nakamurella sp. A5-74 TaxID=3158264 RepID=A0AAU8DJL6_9ACTN